MGLLTEIAPDVKGSVDVSKILKTMAVSLSPEIRILKGRRLVRLTVLGALLNVRTTVYPSEEEVVLRLVVDLAEMALPLHARHWRCVTVLKLHVLPTVSLQRDRACVELVQAVLLEVPV